MMMKGVTRQSEGVCLVFARAKRGGVLPTVGRPPAGTHNGLECTLVLGLFGTQGLCGLGV